MQLAPIGVALCLASAAMAETRQHGNVIFEVPQGWSVGSVDDQGTLTLTTDLPDRECDFCYVYIATGQTTATQADMFLFSQVTRFIDDDDMPQREVILPPKPVNAGGRPAAMLGQKVDATLQVLFAVQLSGRVEVLGFEGSASDEAEVAVSMAVFQRDILPMIEAARYVSEGATPLMPVPEPGPLAGTYAGTSTFWSFGIDGMMKLELAHHLLTFWPDGRFYDGTPPDGSQPFDAAGLLDKGDMNWGSYAVAGGTVTLSFASGETRLLARRDDGLEDDDGTALSVIALLADGERIAGTTSDFFYSGFTPGAGMTGGVAATSDFEYRLDGTFVHDHGATSSASFDAGGDVTGGFATGSDTKTTGTYEIRNGLIILTAEGREYRRVLIYRSGADITLGELTLQPLP